MITHRMSTNSGDSSPEWYKIVAVSFLLITIALLGVVIFITSKKAEVTIVAKEDAKKVTLNVTLSQEGVKPGSMPGSVTSTIFSHTEKYQPTGTKSVAGTSKGEVIIYNKTGLAQPLVKTTRLLSPTGVLFRLSVNTTVPPQGQVTVPVYADQPGPLGDVAPTTFTIPGLIEVKQKTIYAESKAAMIGGSQTVAVLSQDDITSAENNYKEKVKQAFLKTLATDGIEVSVSIASQSARASASAGDQVAAFDVSGTSTLVVVMYNAKDLTDRIAREVSSKIDLTAEKFLAADKKPTVSVSSFSLKDGTAELQVAQDALVTLDANVEKLAPTNFVSKTKEEIQRYVLGLDHVVGVDVKFSPSWMSGAPTSPDRIRVVVKNVK